MLCTRFGYLLVCSPRSPLRKNPPHHARGAPRVALSLWSPLPAPGTGRQADLSAQTVIKLLFYSSATSHSLPAFLSHEVSPGRIEGWVRNPPEGLAYPAFAGRALGMACHARERRPANQNSIRHR